jgi:chromosome segregation and condensation protein ScpB
MMQRFTRKSYLTSILNAWQRTVREQKLRRLTLMSKAWKSLKAQVMLAKQMRNQKKLSLKEASIRWKKYIAQVCFNAFR